MSFSTVSDDWSDSTERQTLSDAARANPYRETRDINSRRLSDWILLSW